MKVLYALGLLALLVAATRADEADVESQYVVNLTAENFDDLVTNSSSWLLDFYAPWCGHCKKLAPQFAAAAQAMVDTKLAFGKVDCTTETALAKRFGIKSYPTLKVWREGLVRNFRHARTAEGMIEFGRSVTGPALIPTDIENIATIEEANSAFLLVLVPEIKMKKLVEMAEKVYTPLARQYQGVLPFYISSDENLFKRFQEKTPQVVFVIVTSSDPPHKKTYFPLQTVEETRMWIEQHRFPSVVELDTLNFEDVTRQGDKRTMIAVLDLEDASADAYIEQLRSLARSWHGLYAWGYLNASRWTAYLKNFGVQVPASVPTVYLLDGAQEVYWVPEKEGAGPLSLAEVRQFVLDVNENKLTAQGNTFFSIGGFFRRLNNYVESFTDNELLFLAVIFVGLFCFLLILLCVCVPPDDHHEVQPTRREPRTVGASTSAKARSKAE